MGLPASLGPLQDNGGPTETHALLPGSPAINAANPAAPGSGGGACQRTDQRGTSRPVGGRCDMGAYESPCGNARRDPGEQCDDGNALAGDCCSPGCLLEAAGSPCTSDGNLCTDDVCDAAGACTHSMPTLCTHADPGKSHITIAGRESVAFSWMATGPVTKADFGNPRSSSTGYRLCAYDNAGGAFLLALTSAGVCDPEFGCWRETPRGFIYEQALPGTVKVKLTAGSPARIAVDAKRTSVGVPPLPLSLPLRVTFSPLEPGSACWDATYSTAAKNSPSLLRATSD